MSNTSTFALGLGSGLALWYATKRATGTAPSTTATGGLSNPVTKPAAPAAPRNCAVCIDAAGLIVDGARVDVDEAARRCVAADRVAMTVSPDAPASTCAALVTALGPSARNLRNARRPSTKAPSESEPSSTFTLVVFPEGVWGTRKRVRYFEAAPPTTWNDARERLQAAGLIDGDALSPNNAGAWRLVTDPERFRSDLAEPLPRGPRARGAARASRSAHRYTREGRTVLRDGEAIIRIDRVDLGNERYAVSPHETDKLAERVVRLLNKHGAR